MTLRDRARDHQPEPRARRRPVEPHAGLEDSRLLLLRDADPGVGDGEEHLLAVESEVGKGSRFTLTLRAAS